MIAPAPDAPFTSQVDHGFEATLFGHAQEGLNAMFPDFSSVVQTILRWFHIIAGIIWIGHLYFFNFVNTPFQGGLEKELKPKVNPALLLRALYFFRWGAMWTFLFGLTLFYVVYIDNGVLRNPDGGISDRGWWIMASMLLGSIMWFNVWFVIWPRQKLILGALLGGPAAPPEAPKVAALASKINTYLSGPMLFGMVAASHVNLWPFNIGTAAVALVLALGLIHGLYASSRKVKTTL
jgi:uncharacterized membrane protein